MKRCVLLSLVLLLTLPAALAAQEAAPEALQAQYAEQIQSLLPQLGSENAQHQFEAQRSLERLCHQAGAPGQEARRAALSRAITDALSPQTPRVARQWLLQQLQWIGRAEVVPGLAELLRDEDPFIRECARLALQHNGAPEASAPLRAELTRAQEARWRVALICALGIRRDAGSAGALAACLPDADVSVAAAAARALGDIATPDAAQALWAARARADAPALRESVNDACLRCAEALVSAGQGDRAAALYRELYESPGEAEHVRTAGLRGLIFAQGEQAVPLLLDLLRTDDDVAQVVAARYVAEVPGADVTRAFAQALPSLPAPAQARLLASLGARGDQGALPAVVQAAGSADRDVRLAALRAMGQVGDASVVPVLALKAAGAAPERDAARQSLRFLRGEGVDQTILAHLVAEVPPAQRIELIRALAGRHAASAEPTLLRLAGQDPDPGVRVQAFGALGVLGDAGRLPVVIDLLIAATDETVRQAAERAAGSLIARAENRNAAAGAVLGALGSAPPGSAAQQALLRLAARAGGPACFAAVLPFARADDETLRDAGIRAIADWPDIAAEEELLQLAQNAASQTHRILALRGYIRLAGLPGDRPATQTLAMYRQAMELSRRPEETRLALAGLGKVADPAALTMVEPFLNHADLRDDAAGALAGIAQSIAAAHPAQARDAGRRVLEITGNQSIRSSVERMLRTLDRQGDADAD